MAHYVTMSCFFTMLIVDFHDTMSYRETTPHRCTTRRRIVFMCGSPMGQATIVRCGVASQKSTTPHNASWKFPMRCRNVQICDATTLCRLVGVHTLNDLHVFFKRYGAVRCRPPDIFNLRTSRPLGQNYITIQRQIFKNRSMEGSLYKFIFKF
jgi:hypothetical protein